MPKKQPSLTLEATPPPRSTDETVSLQRGLVHVDDIAPNPFQPREDFDETYIEDLAASIKEYGLLQEPHVRAATGDHGKPWELLFGENRQRAVKLLVSRGQHDGIIEVKIREANDLKATLLGIIENVKRHDLNVVEEATGYDRLAKMGLTHADIGARVGFSESTITSKMRLLDLPELMRQSLRNGDFSADHGYALLMLPTSKEQNEWGLKALESHWSAKVLHSLIKEHLDTEHKRLNPPLFPTDTPPAAEKTATPATAETQTRKDAEKSTEKAASGPPAPPSTQDSEAASTGETMDVDASKENDAPPATEPDSAPAPTTAPPVPQQQPSAIPSGQMVAAAIPASESMWLKQHGLTTAVAVAHLRRFYTICEAAPNLGRILEMDGLGGTLDYLETLHTGDKN